MAVRTIVTGDAPVLNEICEKIKSYDENLVNLLDDLTDTLHSCGNEAVGLAAPQIGVLQRAAVVDIGDGNGVIELINPVVEVSPDCVEEVAIEGCLSFPGEFIEVKRPNKIAVRAVDRHGKEVFFEAENFLARVFCHEIDHLDGKTIRRFK